VPADAIGRGERVRVREIWAGRLGEGNLWWMPIGVRMRFFPVTPADHTGDLREGKGIDDV